MFSICVVQMISGKITYVKITLSLTQQKLKSSFSRLTNKLEDNMKKHLLLICITLAFLISGTTYGMQSVDDYWQQFVHYTMDVTLEPETHMLTGKETILYRNNSPDTITKFYMHLYPNAYKDENSTMAQEAKKYYQYRERPEEDRGWIEITSFSIDSPGATSSQAVTAYQVDDTILEATLPKPLPPGGEITVRLEFESQIRKISSRSGYRGTQYDFAQWYPKVVVYDHEGWHPEQFHLFTEFYGEYGTWDVMINVPFEYIVGSTGVVVSGDPGWDLVAVDTSLSGKEWRDKYKEMKENIKQLAEKTKTRSVTFHAENSHTFAWTACPDFLYEKGEWDGIPIHVLYRSYVKSRWSKIVAERGNRALAWLSDKFGRYPYPQLTITHGLLGGGMEYPMLVMNASESESLILHEVGHIYFYGILGNNEQEEPWLDEGFTTFQTRWYMEDRYGKLGFDRELARRNRSDFVKKHYPITSNKDGTVNYILFYMNSGFNEPIATPGYKFKDGFSYGVNSYPKGSYFYEMLRYVVGDEKWAKICRTYYERWKFKHVNEARFKKVCEEISGMDLDWFFKQWLHETHLINYSLGSVKKNKLADGKWETKVQINRTESGVMPVEVTLNTDDGLFVTKRWDGFDEEGEVTFVTASKPGKVMLDPNDQILDNSRLDNGTSKIEIYPDYPNMYYNPRDAYVVRWRPSIWYNDIDGVRPGLTFRGTYRNALRNLRAGFWYGPNSSEFDAYFRFSNPLPSLGQRVNYQLLAQKMEGRIEGDLQISWAMSNYMFTPPIHRFSLGVNYSDVRDPKYMIREIDYEGDIFTFSDWADKEIVRTYLSYNVNPRGHSWTSNFRTNIEYGVELSGEKIKFGKLYGELTFRPLWSFVGLHLRGFAGTSFGDTPPIQDLYWADGANPRSRFQSSYLRSRGSFFPEAHLHAPGGGNLRGYVTNPAVGDRIAAFNLELRKRFRFPLTIVRKLLGNSTLVAFYDAGKLWLPSDESGTLYDAGLGLRAQHRFLGQNFTIRVDFPFWLSVPEIDKNGNEEDNVRFRWILGFSQVF